jgi:ATPase subunit of ABC transporter with duplicated ATPase domains
VPARPARVAPPCDAARIRGRLALDPAAIARWTSLSLGERKRWQIGAALVETPNVLLLDEPTNHLDTRARELLVAALARFRGIGVVVSHDRALLDALTEMTLRLSQSAGTSARSTG